MRIVRREEMQSIDAQTIENYGIPSLILMENAGRGAAETIEEYFNITGLDILCVCGKGNNGGDGFVVARHLANSGARLQVLLLGKVDELKGDSLTNAKIVRSMNIDIDEINCPEDLALWFNNIDDYDIVVDAILGTGFSGKPRGTAAKAIELVNIAKDYGSFIVSIDLPSGINANGAEGEPTLAVKADLTATMAYLKPCHVFYPEREFCGNVWVVDISSPNQVFDTQGNIRLMTTDDARLLIPERKPWGNKATFGKLLVVAGSRGMSGAARLTAIAAVRTGAGLIYSAYPQSMHDVFDTTLLEPVKLPLPDTGNGYFAESAAEKILEMEPKVKALALGPGIATHPGTISMVRHLLQEWKKPIVLDADALNAVAIHPDLLKTAKPPLILTPHPGEMARLTNIDSKLVDRKRLDIAEEYSKKWNHVIVLKGAPSVIASTNGIWVNSSGNSGLATAGSGDVLTGIIAGLLAQGLSLSQAARLGVFLHGLAADIATEDIGEHSLIAGDLLNYISDAMLSVFEDEYDDGEQD